MAHRERETSGAGASALTRPWPARTPWWLLLVLGVGAVAIGLALCLDANAPLPEIFLLIALGFLVCGLDDLLILDEPRPRPVPVIIGVSFIVFGVLAAAWGPRYPVVLAYAIAGVLGLAGMGRILAPLLRGERTRLLTVTRGILAIGFGIRVIVWGVRLGYTALRVARPAAAPAATGEAAPHPPTRPIDTIPADGAAPEPGSAADPSA